MENNDVDPRQQAHHGADNKEPVPQHASPGGYSRTSHGPDYHAAEGEHFGQYGMRKDPGGNHSDQKQADNRSSEQPQGVEAFDEEYRTREARDSRPRSIPTGLEHVTDAGLPADTQTASENAAAGGHAATPPSTPRK